MNKQIKKRILLQSIKSSSKKEGYCKYYKNNTKLHENTKWKIFTYLKDLGYDVYSECEFVTGGRADIIAIQDSKGFIIELLNSETESQFVDKLNKYPLLFEVIRIDCKTFKISEFEI